MLHVVILAGGSGTRFWPLSRRDRPKQFLKLAGSRTLIQQSVDRLGDLVDPAQVVVVTGSGLAAGVRRQLPDLPQENVLVEPQPRDTALAVAFAAGVLRQRDPEAVLLVVPSDHVIRPAARFREALREAAALARAPGRIVTFGIHARHPHTGYGYVRRGAPLEHKGRSKAFVVEAFEEKPDLPTAEAYVAGGAHYWNSGIFVWTAETVLQGLATHRPAIAQAVERIVAAWDGPDREQVLAAEFEAAERISIDYALLEHADDVAVIQAEFEWSDVGSWSAIPDLYGQDEGGNTLREAPTLLRDAEGCLVQGEEGRLVALLGVKDLVVVQTRDATLIAHRDRVQEVKALVEGLAGDLEGYR
jgi:mannose-1-phosphate guanylyltransferase